MEYDQPMTEPPTDPRIPPLMSTAEAAETLGYTRQFVVKLAKAGKLRGARVGGAWVFRRAYIESRAAQS